MEEIPMLHLQINGQMEMVLPIFGRRREDMQFMFRTELHSCHLSMATNIFFYTFIAAIWLVCLKSNTSILLASF
jgi:hypothetical protein